MASLRDIVVDFARPSAVARFWAQVLDDYCVAPYDQDELDRLRAMGITDTEDDPSVLVESLSGDGSRLFFQLVPEAKQVKNRLHLDLAADDVTAEISRLVALGAHVLAEHPGHVVLADVEDNEFCLMHVPPAHQPSGPPGFDDRDPVGGRP